MSEPIRIQLSRAKGWRMPPNTVNVARGPGRRWGNPWAVDSQRDAAEAVRLFRAAVIGFESNGSFCRPIAAPDSYIGRIIRNAPEDLRGKNLACWCPLGSPCHADVLLEIANADPAQGETP